jgi:FAD/FMN-containing dehydrogenase
MTTRRGALFRSLVDICGMRFARLAGPADTVGGRPASWVAAPPTIDGVAAIVRLAVEHDLAVVARGAATKLDWGAPPTRVDLVLDTGRLGPDMMLRWKIRKKTMVGTAAMTAAAMTTFIGVPPEKA